MQLMGMLSRNELFVMIHFGLYVHLCGNPLGSCPDTLKKNAREKLTSPVLDMDQVVVDSLE